MFGMFVVLVRFERTLIAERINTRLTAARARDCRGERPFKMTPAKLRLAQASRGRGTLRSLSCARSSASPGRPSTNHVDPVGAGSVGQQKAPGTQEAVRTGTAPS